MTLPGNHRCRLLSLAGREKYGRFASLSLAGLGPITEREKGLELTVTRGGQLAGRAVIPRDGPVGFSALAGLGVSDPFAGAECQGGCNGTIPEVVSWKWINPGVRLQSRSSRRRISRSLVWDRAPWFLGRLSWAFRHPRTPRGGSCLALVSLTGTATRAPRAPHWPPCFDRSLFSVRLRVGPGT